MNPVKSLIDVIYKENFALSVQVKLTFPRCGHFELSPQERSEKCHVNGHTRFHLHSTLYLKPTRTA